LIVLTPFYILIVLLALFFTTYSTYQYIKKKPFINLAIGSIILNLIAIFFPISNHGYSIWGILPLTTLFLIIFVFSLIILEAVKLIQTKIDIKGTNEIYRKAFHLIAFVLLIPLDVIHRIVYDGIVSLFEFVGLTNTIETLSILDAEVFLKTFTSVLIGIFLSVSVIFEIFRFHTDYFSFPELILREKEKKDFAASVYLAISLLLVSIFASWIEFSAIALSVMIGDAMGAIVGKHYGRIKIIEDRSLEGSLAEFFTAFLISTIYLDIISSFAIAITIVLVDLSLATRINDNLLFPPLSLLAIRIIGLVV